MKKVKTGTIKLKDIKHVENSRLREKDDVSDLMHDIEQRGLLHNVGIRQSDNALIYGNRRVKAFEKLGYDEVPCDFYNDVNDEDLLLTNLAENIKTKSIGSIEVGRVCKMLTEKGMTHSEIAEKLGISKGRVTSSISSYNATVGTPFEKLVVFGKLGRGRKGIPETLIWKIQDSISRAKNGKKITKDEWNILLDAAEKGQITCHNISVLRAILMTDDKATISSALSIMDRTKVVYAYFNVNRKTLAKCMRESKIDSDVEFMKHVLRQYNEDLLF